MHLVVPVFTVRLFIAGFKSVVFSVPSGGRESKYFLFSTYASTADESQYTEQKILHGIVPFWTFYG